MSTEVKDNFIQAAFRPYYHTPSIRTVAIGLGVGMGALITTYFFFESSPMLTNAFQDPCATLLPKTDSTAIVAGLVLVMGIVGPFFEESQHRADLEKPSQTGIVVNSLCYGLISGLLPGSVELRTARVFLGTLTSLYFCFARVAADDVWAPAIAHSLCNLVALKSYF